MSRSSSSCLPVRFSILLSALICLAVLSGVPSSAKAVVSSVYAGAVQSIPDPILPCTTSGFAVDATLLTAKPLNDVVEFHRIERSRTSDRTGYFTTRDVATSKRRWLYSYDARTMVLIAAREIQALGQTTFTNSIIGEISGNILYMFRVVTGGSIGCPGGQQCIYLTKFDRNLTELGSILVSGLTGILQNVEDARLNGASTLLLAYNNTASDRFLSSWSIPGGTFIATSAALGPQAPIQFALNADAGWQYAGFGDASRTVKRIQLDSVTVDTTNTFGFPGATTLGALFTIPEAQLVIGNSTSFGGIAAVRNYRTGGLVNVGTTNTYLTTDGSAVARSSFWDVVNNKVYEFRVDAGSGANNLMRTTPDTAVIEQRFNCTGCPASSLPTTDFAVSNARLYNAFESSATVAGVVRVKVCATGGPPA